MMFLMMRRLRPTARWHGAVCAVKMWALAIHHNNDILTNNVPYLHQQA